MEIVINLIMAFVATAVFLWKVRRWVGELPFPVNLAVTVALPLLSFFVSFFVAYAIICLLSWVFGWIVLGVLAFIAILIYSSRKTR